MIKLKRTPDLKCDFPEDNVYTEPRPFVVHYIAYSPEKGDSLEPVEYSIRAVNADGEWKETRYSLTESKRSKLGASKDGLFIINGDSRQYYGDFNAEIARTAMRSEKELKRQRGLINELKFCYRGLIDSSQTANRLIMNVSLNVDSLQLKKQPEMAAF